MKIYVGSSWKTASQLDIVHRYLEIAGHATWDFRKNGFSAEDVELKYRANPWIFLDSPESAEAFNYDRKGLDWCDAGLFILPAGTSVALEAGYLAGQGKTVVTYGRPRETRMDVMWHLARHRFDDKTSIETLISVFENL
jgi:nucleoside 2-deoxyribosyltransferase